MKTKEVAVKEYNDIPDLDVVESVAGEIETIWVQLGKTVREGQIRMVWETGELLRKTEKDNKVNITALVTQVAKDNRMQNIAVGERSLWFALKVYDSYAKDFEKVYDTEYGENITLTKLKRLLTTPVPKKEPTAKEIAEKLYDKFGDTMCKEIVKHLEKLIEK